jgi:hypothetical protein
VRGFFAGDAFMAMVVCDGRDFDGTLSTVEFSFVGRPTYGKIACCCPEGDFSKRQGLKPHVCKPK